MKINTDHFLNSEWEKYCEEQGCDLTEDDLTLLAEHTRAMEEAKERGALFDIALVKSYAYCEEYNPQSGRTEPKQGANYLKEGYIDGFLAGFAYRMSGGLNGGD